MAQSTKKEQILSCMKAFLINRKIDGLKKDIFSMVSANKTEHTDKLKTENTILKNQNASKDLIINILHEQLNSMQQITKHLTHNVNSSIYRALEIIKHRHNVIANLIRVILQLMKEFQT